MTIGQVSDAGGRRRTVGFKLGVTCAVLVVLSGALAYVSLSNVETADWVVAVFAGDVLPGVANIENIESTIWEFRGNCWKHIASSDPARMAAVERRNDELLKELDTQIRGYESGISSEQDRRGFEQIKPLVARYVQAWQGVLPHSRRSENEAAAQMYMATADPVFQELHRRLEERTQWNRDYADRTAQTAVDRASRAGRVTWILALVATLLGLGAAVWLVRSVNRSLRHAVNSVSAVADQVSSASAEISSASQSLAKGASEQAASIEETSASTSEVSSLTNRNRDHAHSAADLVTRSVQEFAATHEELDRMLGAMDEINESSGKISKIIKVIDEIAFQTNILALNAAVEAARAGEAGMGFAVVADEVRGLAQRCAQAARETSALIAESIEKAGAGQARVQQVAEAIRKVSADSTEVKTLVDGVYHGSEEQANGLEGISRAMSQMEQSTQMTAASSEQAASAAQELEAQSASLRDVVKELSGLVGS